MKRALPPMPSLFDAPPVRRVRGIFASTSLDAGEAVSPETRHTQRRQIIEALAYGPLTYQAIHKRTGIELSVVCWRMKELREGGEVQFRLNPDGSIAKAGRRRLVELMPATVRRAG